MRISLELVPRDLEQLKNELELVQQSDFQIDTINIPDLLRFRTRSWEAAETVKGYFPNAIPHIRAIDFPMDQPFPLTEQLIGKEIGEILIIQGDPCPESGKREYPNPTVDFIRKIKREIPSVKIYAAIDPYRVEIKREMDYMKAKMDEGVEGFFSQPFFDLRLMEIYSEKLRDFSVFWGVSPVVTDKSRAYWESRNRAYFPEGFQPTMEWNIRFAKQALSFCSERNYHLYLMPIRLDLKEYLQGLFSECAVVW